MKLRNSKPYKVQVNKTLEVDLYTTFVNAGFPSPAEDHMDVGLDLNDYLLKHPSSTFYIYAKGSSMVNAGIYDGDLMIVDRSLNPSSNNIVIAVINGEFTVKRILKRDTKIYLVPDNKDYNPICISDDDDFFIWGVVTHAIHHF